MAFPDSMLKHSYSFWCPRKSVEQIKLEPVVVLHKWSDAEIKKFIRRQRKKAKAKLALCKSEKEKHECCISTLTEQTELTLIKNENISESFPNEQLLPSKLSGSNNFPTTKKEHRLETGVFKKSSKQKKHERYSSKLSEQTELTFITNENICESVPNEQLSPSKLLGLINLPTSIKEEHRLETGALKTSPVVFENNKKLEKSTHSWFATPKNLSNFLFRPSKKDGVNLSKYDQETLNYLLHERHALRSRMKKKLNINEIVPISLDTGETKMDVDEVMPSLLLHANGNNVSKLTSSKKLARKIVHECTYKCIEPSSTEAQVIGASSPVQETTIDTTAGNTYVPYEPDGNNQNLTSKPSSSKPSPLLNPEDAHLSLNALCNALCSTESEANEGARKGVTRGNPIRKKSSSSRKRKCIEVDPSDVKLSRKKTCPIEPEMSAVNNHVGTCIREPTTSSVITSSIGNPTSATLSGSSTATSQPTPIPVAGLALRSLDVMLRVRREFEGRVPVSAQPASIAATPLCPESGVYNMDIANAEITQLSQIVINVAEKLKLCSETKLDTLRQNSNYYVLSDPTTSVFYYADAYITAVRPIVLGVNRKLLQHFEYPKFIAFLYTKITILTNEKGSCHIDKINFLSLYYLVLRADDDFFELAQYSSVIEVLQTLKGIIERNPQFSAPKSRSAPVDFQNSGSASQNGSTEAQNSVQDHTLNNLASFVNQYIRFQMKFHDGMAQHQLFNDTLSQQYPTPNSLSQHNQSQPYRNPHYQGQANTMSRQITPNVDQLQHPISNSQCHGHLQQSSNPFSSSIKFLNPAQLNHTYEANHLVGSAPARGVWLPYNVKRITETNTSGTIAYIPNTNSEYRRIPFKSPPTQPRTSLPSGMDPVHVNNDQNNNYGHISQNQNMNQKDQKHQLSPSGTFQGFLNSHHNLDAPVSGYHNTNQVDQRQHPPSGIPQGVLNSGLNLPVSGYHNTNQVDQRQHPPSGIPQGVLNSGLNLDAPVSGYHNTNQVDQRQHPPSGIPQGVLNSGLNLPVSGYQNINQVDQRQHPPPGIPQGVLNSGLNLDAPIFGYHNTNQVDLRQHPPSGIPQGVLNSGLNLPVSGYHNTNQVDQRQHPPSGIPQGVLNSGLNLSVSGYQNTNQVDLRQHPPSGIPQGVLNSGLNLDAPVSGYHNTNQVDQRQHPPSGIPQGVLNSGLNLPVSGYQNTNQVDLRQHPPPGISQRVLNSGLNLNAPVSGYHNTNQVDQRQHPPSGISQGVLNSGLNLDPPVSRFQNINQVDQRQLVQHSSSGISRGLSNSRHNSTLSVPEYQNVIPEPVINHAMPSQQVSSSIVVDYGVDHYAGDQRSKSLPQVQNCAAVSGPIREGVIVQSKSGINGKDRKEWNPLNCETIVQNQERNYFTTCQIAATLKKKQDRNKNKKRSSYALNNVTALPTSIHKQSNGQHVDCAPQEKNAPTAHQVYNNKLTNHEQVSEEIESPIKHDGKEHLLLKRQKKYLRRYNDTSPIDFIGFLKARLQEQLVSRTEGRQDPSGSHSSDHNPLPRSTSNTSVQSSLPIKAITRVSSNNSKKNSIPLKTLLDEEIVSQLTSCVPCKRRTSPQDIANSFVLGRSLMNGEYLKVKPINSLLPDLHSPDMSSEKPSKVAKKTFEYSEGMNFEKPSMVTEGTIYHSIDVNSEKLSKVTKETLELSENMNSDKQSKVAQETFQPSESMNSEKPTIGAEKTLEHSELMISDNSENPSKVAHGTLKLSEDMDVKKSSISEETSVCSDHTYSEKPSIVTEETSVRSDDMNSEKPTIVTERSLCLSVDVNSEKQSIVAEKTSERLEDRNSEKQSKVVQGTLKRSEDMYNETPSKVTEETSEDCKEINSEKPSIKAEETKDSEDTNSEKLLIVPEETSEQVKTFEKVEQETYELTHLLQKIGITKEVVIETPLNVASNASIVESEESADANSEKLLIVPEEISEQISTFERADQEAYKLTHLSQKIGVTKEVVIETPLNVASNASIVESEESADANSEKLLIVPEERSEQVPTFEKAEQEAYKLTHLSQKIGVTKEVVIETPLNVASNASIVESEESADANSEKLLIVPEERSEQVPTFEKAEQEAYKLTHLSQKIGVTKEVVIETPLNVASNASIVESEESADANSEKLLIVPEGRSEPVPTFEKAEQEAYKLTHLPQEFGVTEYVVIETPSNVASDASVRDDTDDAVNNGVPVIVNMFSLATWDDLECHDTVGQSQILPIAPTQKPEFVPVEEDEPDDVELNEDVPICCHCSKQAGLMCNGCGLRYYCGDICQAQHWQAVHKYECSFTGDDSNE